MHTFTHLNEHVKGQGHFCVMLAVEYRILRRRIAAWIMGWVEGDHS